MKKYIIAALLAAGIGAAVACYSPNIVEVNQNQDQNHDNAPTVAPTPEVRPTPGSNVVSAFKIFCYGFGAQPGQPEPDHDKCQLPTGYPSIDMTASPKDASNVDVPNPGSNVTWSIAVDPPGAATLTVKSDNPFNSVVSPKTPRVPATMVVTSNYIDPTGKAWTATRNASIQ